MLYALSCRKNNDALQPLPHSQDYEFLKLSPSSPAVLHRIAAKIYRQNLSGRFLARIQEEEGIPVWEKSVISSLSPVGNNTDTLVLVPLVIKSHKQISGFLVCKAGKEDVDIIDLVRTRYYEAYGFEHTESKVTGNAVVLQSLLFDQAIFGDSVFRLKDPRLFSSKASKKMKRPEEIITVMPVKTSASASNRYVESTRCFTVTHAGDKGNLTGTAPGESNNYYWTEEVCYVQFIYIPDPVVTPISGGGSLLPVGTPSTSPLGSGGTASALTTVNWYDGCKDGKVMALMLPSNQYREISCGATLQPYEPKPDLKFTYNLTEEDQKIINQIKEEDELADALLGTPTPCHGTNRMGNKRFSGTIEHWLIQYDYLMSNSNSFREYFIPQSGINGGPGYADLVNKNTYEIFEIKLNNTDGRKYGAEEVQRYVDKANIHCSPSLEGISRKWTQGLLYASRVLPYPLDITKQLNTFMAGPGVIVYEITQKNANPQQVLLPKEVLDKIKSLLEELKKDMENLEEKILVYLQQYPEIVKYIKAAAVGTAVTIVIGTIVEDIITLGAGVADDWASFLMAYKLVRIARLL